MPVEEKVAASLAATWPDLPIPVTIRRPSASALKDRYTDRFFAARDRNGQRDLSALAHGARFDAVHAEAMALPGVARLHHLNVADYVARLCAAAGTESTEDARWQEAMAAAAGAEP